MPPACLLYSMIEESLRKCSTVPEALEMLCEFSPEPADRGRQTTLLAFDEVLQIGRNRMDHSE